MNSRLNRNIISLIFAASLALVCAACSENVIDIDLNSAQPHIVIEGTVTEGAGPHKVRISQTTDFFKPADYPPVTGATVSISDSTGASETLVEQEPGVYLTSKTIGTVGMKYTLSVNTSEAEYRASSTMLVAGYIDSLAIEIESEKKDEEEYIIHCYFQDIPDVKEYYRLKVYINNNRVKDYFMYQDRLTDGNYLDAELWVSEEYIATGDTVIVETQTIDRPVYSYFSTLYDVTATISDGMSMFTGTPANPTTNLSNNALGYFSAYTASYDTLIVDKARAIKGD